MGDMKELAKAVNISAEVNVEKVCIIEKKDFSILQEGETSKKKEYRAYCYAKKPLTQEHLEKLNLTETVLKQSTPIRVLHRRNVDVRPRAVHK